MSGGIMLGNLSLDELGQKHGFSLSEEDKNALNPLRQQNADVKKGTDVFHIFDMPCTILCGTMNVAQKVYDILKKYEIHGQINIAVS